MPVAVVMAGGRGSRMHGAVKPLVRVCGRPLVEHALDLARSVAWRTGLAVSPYTRRSLGDYCSRVLCVETSGAGYPVDMGLVARLIAWSPVLFLPSDLVGLDMGSLQALLGYYRSHGGGRLYTLLCRGRPVGVSLYAGGWSWTNVEAGCDPVNVNTWSDVEEAERRCLA